MVTLCLRVCFCCSPPFEKGTNLQAQNHLELQLPDLCGDHRSIAVQVVLPTSLPCKSPTLSILIRDFEMQKLGMETKKGQWRLVSEIDSGFIVVD